MSEITIPNNLKPIAYLIGNHDQEMIASYKIAEGFCSRAFTNEACLACRFKTMSQARIVLEQFDKPELFIVPLFDMGDKFAVPWPQ